MSKVIANMSMSLDGYIADTADGIDQLFGWMGNGEVEVPTAVEWATFRMSSASADYMREALNGAGALIAGRHLFDITQGWGGTHPLGVPVVVVTHSVPGETRLGDRFRFVTEGVAAAVDRAKALAAEAGEGKDVVIMGGGEVIRQSLAEGLVDELVIHLAPLVLGGGTPLFGDGDGARVKLRQVDVRPSAHATHVSYEVERHSRS